MAQEAPRCGSRLRWTKHEVIMAALTRDEIAVVLKPAEDTVVAQIIVTGANKEEPAEAYAWMQSDEALMNTGRPLPSGRVGQIIAVLQAVEDDAPGSHRLTSARVGVG